MIAWIKANPATAGTIIAIIIAMGVILWPLPYNEAPNPQQGDIDYAANTLRWLWAALLPWALKAGAFIGICLYIKHFRAESGRKSRQAERDRRDAKRTSDEQAKGIVALAQLKRAEPVLKACLNAGNAGRNDVSFDRFGRIQIRVVQEKILPKK